jgi:hypothetical protein
MSIHGTRGKYELPGIGMAPHLLHALSYDSDHAPIREKTLKVEMSLAAHTSISRLLCARRSATAFQRARRASRAPKFCSLQPKPSRSGSAVALSHLPV